LNEYKETDLKLSTLFTAATTASLLFCSHAAYADALDNIKQAKKIRIAVELALPPYGMTDDKMQPSGSDVETARLLAKDLGVELKIVPTTGPTRIPFLQTNKADLVIAVLSVTPERQKVIDFSPPYSVVEIVVAAPKNISIKGYQDLAGKTLAITRGNVQEQELMKKASGAQIIRYDDDATLVTAAVSGQAEVVSTGATMLMQIQKKNPGRQMETKFVVKTFELGIGMKKNEPKLNEWVSNWVKSNHQNGKLADIYKRNFGSNLPVLMQ
jgi:polar amino acid transport system substrate-binding protein